MKLGTLALRSQAAVTLVALVLAGAGCTAKTVDLQAVRTFGTTTEAASKAFEEISADYLSSCLRYREYRAETRIGTQPLTAVPSHTQIAPMPLPSAPASAGPAQTLPSQPPATPALPMLPVGGDDRDCKVSALISARWALENRVLVGYVRALAAVAGVGTAPSKTSFEALGSSLHSLGVFGSDATASAAADLADAIVSTLVARQVDGDVVRLASDSKAPVDQLVAGLETVSVAYRAQVLDEMAELDTSQIAILAYETQRLRRLRQEAGLPADTSATATLGEQLAESDTAHLAARVHVTVAVEQERLLAALLQRERIARRRTAWQSAVADAVRRANMASDYYSTVSIVGATNDALVKTRGGVEAVVATVKPFVDQLIDPVDALVNAAK